MDANVGAKGNVQDQSDEVKSASVPSMAQYVRRYVTLASYVVTGYVLERQDLGYSPPAEAGEKCSLTAMMFREKGLITSMYPRSSPES